MQILLIHFAVLPLFLNPTDDLLIEEGTPADLFDRPQQERTRRFLSKMN